MSETNGLYSVSAHEVIVPLVGKETVLNPINIMEAKEQVLNAMREAGAPVNAGKIAEMTGLDRKVVDKAFADLKKEGAIVSPVRCKWQPA